MTSEKEITCIVCPIGCKILVKTDGSDVTSLEGDKCKQGRDYAVHEALDPRRMLTTSALVDGGLLPLVSVKTSTSIPKDKVFPILQEIKQLLLPAPVHMGQVVIKDVAGLNVDVIATKTVEKEQ